MGISIESFRLGMARATKVGGALLLAVATLWTAQPSAATLDPAVLPKIEAATFEVVQAKPEHDPLTYEKPLPLDLLPFQERTDKYYSIGTAFAIGPNRYVTAAHVLRAGIGSPWGPIELRDSKGKVYSIDKIEKFSLRKDFVVFSLAKPPSDAVLEVNAKPVLNSLVYAVGNALGTGVVIRDGLYTSDTPEQQDGAWKWMRFSAAASPGNSGGPLLDQNGKVIGVVLMKSANENLNYALPISEVLNAPDHQAVINERVTYRLDIFDAVQSSLFKANFTLPMSLDDFDRTFQKLFDANSEAELKALLGKESAELFPHGNGANLLLYSEPETKNFPALIVRNSDGQWALAEASPQSYTLDDNSYVEAGTVANNLMLHVRRPDHLAAATFYGSISEPAALLVKAGMFQRRVGSEQIRITSLGKPFSESNYVDHWGRHWQTATWSLPYADAYVMVYSLPVPDGSMMMLRTVPQGHLHDEAMDMTALTDFIYVNYQGTLAQWRDFLRNTALLPTTIKNIRFDFDYGHRFSYASSRIAFSFTPELQTITPDSLLQLGLCYFLDGDRPVWDVAEIRVWKDKAPNDYNRVDIQRYAQPPPQLNDGFQSAWQRVAQRQHPYDAVAHDENDVMEISAVGDPAAKPRVLYTVFYGVEGEHPQDVMKARLDLLMKNLQVKEH